MSFESYEYELVPTGHRSGQPLTDTDLIHSDAAVTARAMTKSRKRWPRRFVFYETLPDDSGTSRRTIYPSYLGFRNTDDGSVVILDGGGHPHGRYASLASAWHRLRRGNELWLAWLEPDPAMPEINLTVAEQETRHGIASTWYLTIPFTAHGPAEARQRAVDIAVQLQPCVPGLDLLDVTYRHGGDLDTEAHVFCDTPGCLQIPGHAGDHQPPPTAPEPDTGD